MCKALFGLRSVFCSQSARSRLRTGRAHVLVWGTPRNARFALNAQSDVMAARMVGIRQEGESLPEGTFQEGRGARSANGCHDVTEKVRRLRVAALVLRDEKKRKKKRAKQASVRVNRIPEAGMKDPLSWAQDTTS